MRSTGTREFPLALLCLLFAGSCSGAPEYVLVGTATAPGADGYAETEEEEDGSRVVTIHMERLPPPRHLGDGLKSYVVWFEGEGRKPIRAGELTYEEGTRTGDLTATAPFTEVRVRITAETEAKVETPGSFTIVERALTEE
jgi:hypothetical protein